MNVLNRNAAILLTGVGLMGLGGVSGYTDGIQRTSEKSSALHELGHCADVFDMPVNQPERQQACQRAAELMVYVANTDEQGKRLTDGPSPDSVFHTEPSLSTQLHGLVSHQEKKVHRFRASETQAGVLVGSTLWGAGVAIFALSGWRRKRQVAR
jgi:hypothetical protein